MRARAVVLAAGVFADAAVLLATDAALAEVPSRSRCASSRPGFDGQCGAGRAARTSTPHCVRAGSGFSA